MGSRAMVALVEIVDTQFPVAGCVDGEFVVEDVFFHVVDAESFLFVDVLKFDLPWFWVRRGVEVHPDEAVDVYLCVD